MKRRRRTFFLIIGLTVVFIIIAAGLNRLLAPAPWTPNPSATATVAAFFATVEANDHAGLPTPSAVNYTGDGLQVEIVQIDYDAWPVVHLENQFNTEPDESKRMVLLTLKIINVAGDADGSLNIGESNFRLIDAELNEYTTFRPSTSCGVIPNALDGSLKRGETIVGNVCMQTPREKTRLTLAYDSKSYGILPSFFALPE